MTIEITSNFHSFIVFLTLSMGISYAFFHRPGFGIGKILALILVGGPILLVAYERHHIVDVSLGLIVGFLHAKGLITSLNPLRWIDNFFNFQIFHSVLRRNKKSNEQARAQAEANQSDNDFREQEAHRRQEQAKKDRERTKQRKTNSKQQKSQSSSDTNNRQQSKNQRSSSNSYKQSGKSYQQTKPKPKTKREQALEVLGLEPDATMEEAKRARNKLMSLYHPDKLAGLPEGRRKQAEDEAKKINVAWSEISKSKK